MFTVDPAATTVDPGPSTVPNAITFVPVNVSFDESPTATSAPFSFTPPVNFAFKPFMWKMPSSKVTTPEPDVANVPVEPAVSPFANANVPADAVTVPPLSNRGWNCATAAPALVNVPDAPFENVPLHSLNPGSIDAGPV